MQLELIRAFPGKSVFRTKQEAENRGRCGIQAALRTRRPVTPALLQCRGV